MARSDGPVVIDLDEGAAAPGVDPASAPPPPDAVPEGPSGEAMQHLARMAARKPSRLGRFFWLSLTGLLGFALSLAAWTWITELLSRAPILGYIATGLLAAFCLAALALAARELAGFARLGRLDRLRQTADRAAAQDDLDGAKAVAGQMIALYRTRPELRLGREAAARARDEAFDTGALFSALEASLMAPLDRAAQAEIEAAARQVATITAFVPIALADVLTALTANLRMIRRIAQIYGGRGSSLGAWRLTRAVLSHLVATGAVAVGDDMIGSLAGGSFLSKLSRRFGEGLVNGALTARVGVAAMEVCRPMPFGPDRRPAVTALIRRALAGLFQTGSETT